MADIWVYHPELDRYAEIPESAFLIQARSGWVQQDPPPEPDEEAEESITFDVVARDQAAKKSVAKKTASASAEPTEGDEK